MFAKLDGQLDAGFKRVEQASIGQVQQRAEMHAERFAGRFGLGHSHIGPRREGGRLAIGKIDDSDLVSGVDEAGER